MPPPRLLIRSLLLPLLLLAAGCSMGGSYTLVEKHMQPSHFRFVDVIEKTAPGPDGWRAACVHLSLRHAGGSAFICRFGVEMPIATLADGMIPAPLAQRIAADCSNLAAELAFSSTTPATPLGLACESFKKAFRGTLGRAVAGARVMTVCHASAEPTVVP
ncbi:hypothetical protein P2318_11715 [Myxococcaceae bacterium GXIMD 01537]